MAANLAKAGFQVSGLDTAPAASAKAEASGVTITTDLAELAATADAIVTMLPDSPEVESCYLGDGGIARAARPGTLVIDSSTVAPATTDRLAEVLSAAGHTFIDAPVGRSPIQAAEGTLLFMIGGADADLARAQPLFDAMGSDFIRCGGVGSGIRTKLVNNLLSQATC